ncbi:MAG: DHHA2 domain-containing protein, partial [Opitutales bacterium]
DDILEALEANRAENGLDFAALLVTDVNKQNSLLVFLGDEDIRKNISYGRVERPSIFDLPGIVSRKKQVIPYFTQLLDSIGASA